MGFNSGFKGLIQRVYDWYRKCSVALKGKLPFCALLIFAFITRINISSETPYLSTWRNHSASCTPTNTSLQMIISGFSSCVILLVRRSQWSRGLRRRSAAARLLRLWVRIPPGAWIFVCCECSVFSGRGLCDELITRP